MDVGTARGNLTQYTITLAPKITLSGNHRARETQGTQILLLGIQPSSGEGQRSTCPNSLQLQESTSLQIASDSANTLGSRPTGLWHRARSWEPRQAPQTSNGTHGCTGQIEGSMHTAMGVFPCSVNRKWTSETSPAPGKSLSSSCYSSLEPWTCTTAVHSGIWGISQIVLVEHHRWGWRGTSALRMWESSASMWESKATARIGTPRKEIGALEKTDTVLGNELHHYTEDRERLRIQVGCGWGAGCPRAAQEASAGQGCGSWGQLLDGAP